MSPEPLVTAPELARMLGMSKQWVYKWAELGKLPCVRLPGRAIRFDPADVRRFLADLKHTSPVAQGTILPFSPPSE